jgi:hypothetical protein
MTPMVFMLDEFPLPEDRQQIFEIIDSLVKDQGMSIPYNYFVAERIEMFIRVAAFPRSEIDMVAKSKNIVLPDAIRFMAREMRNAYEYSVNLYRQRILH